MTFHSREELERLGRFARREFSHALMSDTKWRKLFAVLDESGLAPEHALVKFIDVDEIKSMRWPRRSSLHPPRPYVDTLEFGPIELRSIEWLLIPQEARIERGNNLPARVVEQAIDAIERLVTSSGRYPLERSKKGLKVIGYRH